MNRERINNLIRNSKIKMEQLPVIRFLVFYWRDIRGGFDIYRSLIKKYGSKTKFIICPHTGTGDIYAIGRYFHSYLDKNNITHYTFLFRGKSEQKIGELYGIKGDTILSTTETWRLLMFCQFLRSKKINVIQLHHYPYIAQSHIHLEHMEGYKGITFDDMFKYVAMGLKEDVKPVLPEFKRPDNLEKIFQEKNLQKGNTVILAPYSASIRFVPFEIWEHMAEVLMLLGYCVATNCVANKEKPIHGTVALSFDYEVSVSYLEYAGYFIGIRSGICDIISTAKCKKIVLYPFWDFSLLWKGIAGKTLQFFGLNNNHFCDDCIEIEFDNQSMNKIVPTIEDLFVHDRFSVRLIRLKDKMKPVFKNSIAIAIVFNEFFAPIVSVNLQSIVDFSSKDETYDIILLNDGLDSRTRHMLLHPFQGRNNFSVRFVDFRYLLVNYSFHTERGYLPITYGRLAAPHILSEFEKIIYLDFDTIMNCDLSELYQIDLKDHLLAGVKDLPMIAWGSMKENEEYRNLKQLKLKDYKKYINAGVLIFNNRLFNKKFPVKFLLEYSVSRKWRWMDQDILNKLCDGNILLLPPEYNVLATLRDDAGIIRTSNLPELILEYKRAIRSPKIIHYIGCSFKEITNPVRQYNEYWKLARKSPYYEMLLHRFSEQLLVQSGQFLPVGHIIALFKNR